MDSRGEIENLMARYCRTYDDGDLEGYAELFRRATISGMSTPEEIVKFHSEGIYSYDGEPRTRHVVTNVIGGPREGVSAEIHKLNLLDGDTLLFCTDGLTEPVGDDAIAEVLNHHLDPDDACTRLVDLALNRGGPDNVTVVVVQYQVDQQNTRNSPG